MSTVREVLGLYSYTQLLSSFQSSNNQVWSAFVDRFTSEASRRIRQRKEVDTYEAVLAELKQMFQEVDHPVHKYLHIYKCGSCPEFHKIELACLILKADPVNQEEQAGPPPYFFTNVTLAFPQPCQSSDGIKGELYHVRENIPKLRLLSGHGPNIVFVDPDMADVAMAEETVTH